MMISPGGRIGPYEVVARIGVGGMGEVWKARDARLERDVAIKVLPAEVAGDAQFRIRFEREARAVAQLAHPNICSLFDVGEGYFVMELLDGETLGARLARGPLSPQETARIGSQIADALDSAHRHGIVHRDLKPENVMLTGSGAKLLDFGLAWNVEATARRRRLTETGMVIGTVQYMAPEQAQGAAVDHRADIFALGTLLYEAITGRPAFQGETMRTILAAIVASDPVPVAEVRPDVPPALDHLIARCLQKSPAERWQSAHDVAEELRWIAQGSGSGTRAVPRVRWRRNAVLAAAIATALIAVVWGLYVTAKNRGQELPKIAMSIELPADIDVVDLNVSNDARTLGILGTRSADPQIWVRRLDSFDFELVPGTEGAHGFVFSPDVRSMAFIARKQLWVFRFGEHGPRAVCPVPPTRTAPLWTTRNTIIFDQVNGPLLEVDARSGATPRPITVLGAGEIQHDFPDLSDDGEVLFFVVTFADAGDPRNGYYVQRLGEREKHFVAAAQINSYSYVDGWIAIADSNDRTKVVFRRFDRARLAMGDAQRTVSVGHELGGWILASNGTVFSTDPLVWPALSLIDRSGNVRTVKDTVGFHPRLSPDGKRVVYTGDGNAKGIWVADLNRGTRLRVTNCVGARIGVWTPDGRRLVYGCAGEGGYDLFIRNADGTGRDELLVRTPRSDVASDVSPDGKTLLVSSGSRDSGSDVLVAPLDGSAAPRPLFATPADERQAVFSPDGKLIAYASDESGRPEVYVQAVDAAGDRVQVSVEGGSEPRWRRDGRELFLMLPTRKIAAVEIRRDGQRIEAGTPQPLFDVTVEDFPAYDVSADGQTFVAGTGGIRTRRVLVTTNILPPQ